MVSDPTLCNTLCCLWLPFKSIVEDFTGRKGLDHIYWSVVPAAVQFWPASELKDNLLHPTGSVITFKVMKKRTAVKNESKKTIMLVYSAV